MVEWRLQVAQQLSRQPGMDVEAEGEVALCPRQAGTPSQLCSPCCASMFHTRCPVSPPSLPASPSQLNPLILPFLWSSLCWGKCRVNPWHLALPVALQGHQAKVEAPTSEDAGSSPDSDVKFGQAPPLTESQFSFSEKWQQ